MRKALEPPLMDAPHLELFQLPTFFSTQPIPQLDVDQSMHTSPDDFVARRRIAGSREVAAELCELDEAELAPEKRIPC